MNEIGKRKKAQPDLGSFIELASKGLLVPVHRRMIADLLTPVSAFQRIRHHGKCAFLLESIEGGEKIARYSFLGCDPFLVMTTRNGRVRIKYRDGSVEESEIPFLEALRAQFARYRAATLEGLPPFCGGAVGYLGYDLVRQFEAIPDRAADDLGLDDAVMLFFNTVLAFDHLKHQIWIISNAPLTGDTDLPGAYEHAVRDILVMERILSTPPPEGPAGAACEADKPEPTQEISSSFTEIEYKQAVRKAKEYIRAGDIFQVVLSQRFQMPLRDDPLEIYRALRVINPSPYMFFLDLGEHVVAGASPEMLIKVQGRQLEYRPIAGTRRRGATEEEDARLAADLLADPKERAEHVMLVDLGRNDLGRVSRFGSVRPKELFFIEKYSHVIHLVSALEGTLTDDKDRFDALAAAFPAGTVSGAPKIRAMEIIDELEPFRRGVYAGAVAYIDFSGNLDSCIAIRTFVIKDSVAYIQAGGGIVADSTPEGEFQESVNKASALVRAIELARSGFELG
jgi:anthranilate synthase component I